MPPSHAHEAGGPFRAIVADLPAALYTTDADGWLTYFNDAAIELWGRRPEIGVDRWCGSWRLYWPDGAPMPHEACPMAIAIKSRAPVRGLRGILERADGGRVGFTPFPTPMFDAAGDMTGAMNVMIPDQQTADVPAKRRRAPAPDLTIASLFDQTARLVHGHEGGMSPMQWAILRYLARSRRERDHAQIAAYLSLPAANVARDMSMLVRHGLVQARAEADRFALTRSGREALKLDPVERLARAIAQLSEERRVALAQDLEQIAGELARDGED